VKKGQNGRKSLRRLNPTVGCNANKRRRRSRKRRNYIKFQCLNHRGNFPSSVRIQTAVSVYSTGEKVTIQKQKYRKDTNILYGQKADFLNVTVTI